MAEKHFYLPIFPGDELKSPVSICSLAAQMLWMRMRWIMSDSDRYGYLCVNGAPIARTILAKRTGCDCLEQYDALLSELDSVSVISRTGDGIIFDPIMVNRYNDRKVKKLEDAERQRRCRENRAANPKVIKENVTCDSHSNVTPSELELQSELSKSKTKPKTNPPPLAGSVSKFQRFWDAYPRREGRGAAEKAFLKVKPSDELVSEMITAVENHKLSAQWRRDNGQYIPHPATWINQCRWKDDLNATQPKLYSEATARSLTAIEEYHRLKGD